MIDKKNEKLAIGWCDNGTVDGKFMDGILNTILNPDIHGMNIIDKIRVSGNQIGRQRQTLFDMWSDLVKTDWLLWVDSDIVLTPEVLKILCDTADKNNKPVVSGLYFISKQSEQTLMQPYAAIFHESDDEELKIIHPVPENSIFKIDSAGFGILLMHKSIIHKIRSVDPDYSIFAEKQGIGDEYVSEDIVFFRKLKKTKIPLYVNTQAHVEHIKRFSFDHNFYNLYWNGIDKNLIIQK
jgi:hypothetical protein